MELRIQPRHSHNPKRVARNREIITLPFGIHVAAASNDEVQDMLDNGWTGGRQALAVCEWAIQHIKGHVRSRARAALGANTDKMPTLPDEEFTYRSELLRPRPSGSLRRTRSHEQLHHDDKHKFVMSRSYSDSRLLTELKDDRFLVRVCDLGRDEMAYVFPRFDLADVVNGLACNHFTEQEVRMHLISDLCLQICAIVETRSCSHFTVLPYCLHRRVAWYWPMTDAPVALSLW